MVNVINRIGISEVLREMLEADTAVLYGAGKLVQDISTSATDFIQAKVNNAKPYKLFLSCEDRRPLEILPQTARHAFDVGYRIEGVAVDVDAAKTQIDSIDARISALVNNQMHGGLVFTDYYSDSSTRIVDAEYDNSGLAVEVRNGKVVAECSGAVTVVVITYS